MDQITVAVVVGSLRKESFNRKLACALEMLAPPELKFHHVEIGDLPLYNQDDDAHQAESVLRMKREVREAQALLFVTPEYNRSIPGVLKNALDHGSRPYGNNAWAGKRTGVIGASPGKTGTALAQQHLRNVLAYLDAQVMGQPEAFIQANKDLFEADGSLAQGSRDFLAKWMASYVAWITRA